MAEIQPEAYQLNITPQIQYNYVKIPFRELKDRITRRELKRKGMSLMRGTPLETQFVPRIEKRIYFKQTTLENEFSKKDLKQLNNETAIAVDLMKMQKHLDDTLSTSTRPIRRLRNIDYRRSKLNDRTGSISAIATTSPQIRRIQFQ